MSSAKSWECTVCGYIHNGDTPPDECPICGATKEYFTLTESAESEPESPTATQWRCLNCEYIHDGNAPPVVCPVCAANSDRFEPFIRDDSDVIIQGSRGLRIVIAGAGIAGVSAAEAAHQSAPDAEILLLSKESHLPYYRLNLTRYLAEEITGSTLPLHDRSWYDSRKINLELNSELCEINADQKKIRLKNDKEMNYDRLILAMGSHPFIPPIPGANLQNVTALRTKDDADFILENCKPPIRIVVIGGGLLGLETAGALAKQGMDVTLLEGHDWLLPRQLDQSAGIFLERFVEAAGIKLLKNARTKEIQGDDRVQSVLLEDNTKIPAELVIITTGVRSNSYVARLAGLDVNRGIVVNNHLASSIEHIYAAGDVAEHRGINYGTWGPSQFQGTIAGSNAAGRLDEFIGVPRSNMLKVLGVDMFSIGRITGEDASYRAIQGNIDDAYYHFLFRDSHMVGAILLGKTEASSKVKHLIEKGIDCSSLLNQVPEVKDVLDYLHID